MSATSGPPSACGCAAAALRCPGAAAPGGCLVPTPPSTARPARSPRPWRRPRCRSAPSPPPLRPLRGSRAPALRCIPPFAKAEGRLPGRSKLAVCCGWRVPAVSAASAARCNQR
eukprot:15447020-Alexandrium_andersonii.AAC.1